MTVHLHKLPEPGLPLRPVGPFTIDISGPWVLAENILQGHAYKAYALRSHGERDLICSGCTRLNGQAPGAALLNMHSCQLEAHL